MQVLDKYIIQDTISNKMILINSSMTKTSISVCRGMVYMNNKTTFNQESERMVQTSWTEQFHISRQESRQIDMSFFSDNIS